jgi:arginine N-succinyltransferase
MVAHTDRIQAIRDAIEHRVGRIGTVEGERRLATAGRLAGWRAAYAAIETLGPDEIAIDPEGARLLGVREGDTVMHVGRA